MAYFEEVRSDSFKFLFSLEIAFSNHCLSFQNKAEKTIQQTKYHCFAQAFGTHISVDTVQTHWLRTNTQI